MQKLVASPLKEVALNDEDVERLKKRFPEMPTKPDKECPTCGKNHGIGVNGTFIWQGQEWECDCLDQIQRHKHYLNAGIGLSYQRLSFDDYKAGDTALNTAKAYLNSHDAYIRNGMGLIAYSDCNGTGKTMLETLVLKELVQRGYNCYFTTFANMLDMISGGWKSNEEREEYKRKVEAARILMIDEVGKESNVSQFSVSHLDNIIRTRVQNSRPTFVTMNLSLEDFQRLYGTGVMSLVCERSIDLGVSATTDYRLTMGQILRDEIERGETRPIF